MRKCESAGKIIRQQGVSGLVRQKPISRLSVGFRGVDQQAIPRAAAGQNERGRTVLERWSSLDDQRVMGLRNRGCDCIPTERWM